MIKVFTKRNISIWCWLASDPFDVWKQINYNYGHWEYKSPDNCQKVQICQRDGMAITYERTVHQWSPWTTDASNPCVNVRECHHCHIQARKATHIWGEWNYIKSGSCEQVMSCQRCSEEQHQILHEWLGWRFEGREICAHSCEGVRSKKERNTNGYMCAQTTGMRLGLAKNMIYLSLLMYFDVETVTMKRKGMIIDIV